MQDYQGRFIQTGLSIDHTPGADVSAGDVVVQNNIVGIAKRDIDFDALEQGALAISGVFDVVKAEEAFATVGANIYWDDDGDPYNGTIGSGAATATAPTNTWMGCVLETAETTDETVRILLRSTVSLQADAFALTDLSDINDTMNYTAGDLLIGSGTEYVEKALSGPWNLSAAGLLSMDSATKAASGANQANAIADAPLADGFSLVSGADGAKGVALPTAAAGGFCIVKNNGAAVLKLYPHTTDKIDAEAVNVHILVPAYAVVVLVAYDAEYWYSNTIPTGALTRAMLAQEDLAVYRIPLQNLRSNTGLVLDATGGDTLFSIVNGGMGVGTLTLKGEEAISEAETTTLCFEFAVPPEYVAGQTIEIDVEAKCDSSGAGNASAETIQIEAYKMADAGTVSADLADGGAQSMAAAGDVFATYTSVVTPTGLVAGDKLMIFVQTVITEDAATAVFAVIGNIEVQLDIKG